jgi:hypothetical protein
MPQNIGKFSPIRKVQDFRSNKNQEKILIQNEEADIYAMNPAKQNKIE